MFLISYRHDYFILTFRNEDNWYNTSLTDILSDEGDIFGIFLSFFISKTSQYNNMNIF